MTSSDSENSNWDDESSISDVEQVPSKPAPSSKPKTTKGGEFVIPAKLRSPCADPSDERARLEKISILRDKALAGDMFGCDSDSDESEAEEDATPDAKESNELKTAISVNRLQDIEALCQMLVPKIQTSQAKSQAWLRMFDILLGVCAPKMEPQDLMTLQNKVRQAHTERKTAKNFQFTSAKKGTDLNVNIRDPRGELDIALGLDDESDDSEYDNYDDGFDM